MPPPWPRLLPWRRPVAPAAAPAAAAGAAPASAATDDVAVAMDRLPESELPIALRFEMGPDYQRMSEEQQAVARDAVLMQLLLQIISELSAPPGTAPSSSAPSPSSPRRLDLGASGGARGTTGLPREALAQLGALLAAALLPPPGPPVEVVQQRFVALTSFVWQPELYVPRDECPGFTPGGLNPSLLSAWLLHRQDGTYERGPSLEDLAAPHHETTFTENSLERVRIEGEYAWLVFEFGCACSKLHSASGSGTAPLLCHDIAALAPALTAGPDRQYYRTDLPGALRPLLALEYPDARHWSLYDRATCQLLEECHPLLPLHRSQSLDRYGYPVPPYPFNVFWGAILPLWLLWLLWLLAPSLAGLVHAELHAVLTQHVVAPMQLVYSYQGYLERQCKRREGLTEEDRVPACLCAITYGTTAVVIAWCMVLATIVMTAQLHMICMKFIPRYALLCNRTHSFDRAVELMDARYHALSVRRIAVTNAAQFKFERLHVEAQVLANELKLGHMDSECAICLESFAPGEQITPLPGCPHVFHKRCLVQLQAASCPLCRMPVGPVPATPNMREVPEVD